MKKLISILLVSFMLLGLAACGSTTDNAGTSTDTTGNESTKPEDSGSKDAATGDNVITITYRDDGSTHLKDWMNSAAESFPVDGVTVNVAPIQASEGDYFAKIALQLQSDSPPDIVTEDTFQLPNDAVAGYLTNLDDYVKDYGDWQDGKFFDSMKNGVTYNGSIYGIPYNTDTRGMWYNKEIFEAAGIGADWQPTNWEEIFDALNKIKEYDSDIVPFWCNSGIATGEATSMQTYEMLLYSTGARLMDEAGEKWVVKSDDIIKSLEFVERIYKDELGPPLSKVLNGQGSNAGSREYLPQGKLGVLLDGNWITGNYKPEGASPWPEYGDKLGFAAFPTSEGQDPTTMTLAGGWALSIPENSKNKETSFEFIKHAMSLDVYKKAIVSMGNITSRTDVAIDPEYTSEPFMETATEFLESADFRPQNDKYSEVSTCIQEMVESVATASSTPQEAMEKYAADVTAIVGEDKVVEK